MSCEAVGSATQTAHRVSELERMTPGASAEARTGRRIECTEGIAG